MDYSEGVVVSYVSVTLHFAVGFSITCDVVGCWAESCQTEGVTIYMSVLRATDSDGRMPSGEAFCRRL